jgi:hypothetical protein
MSFTRVQEILRHEHIPARYKLALMGICDHADEKTGKSCYPSAQTVAAEIGVSTRTVARAIKWAKTSGFPWTIKKISLGRDNHLSNEYIWPTSLVIAQWEPTDNLSGGTPERCITTDNLSLADRQSVNGRPSDWQSNKPVNKPKNISCSFLSTDIASATPERATPTLRDESVIPDFSLSDQGGMSDEDYYDLKHCVMSGDASLNMKKRFNAEFERREAL